LIKTLIFVILQSNILSAYFKVAKSTSQEVVIEFQGPDNFYKMLQVGDGSVAILDGEELLYKEPGAPYIPFFRIPIALDFRGKYTVEMTIVEKEQIPLKLAGLPEYRNDGLSLRFKKVTTKGTFPSKNLVYADTTYIQRGTPYANLHFSPYIYNTATGILTYIKKARFRVIREANSTPVKTGKWDIQFPSLKRTLLNYKGQSISLNGTKIKQNPFDEASLWFSVQITDDGVYRVAYEDLKKAGLNFEPPTDQVAVYTPAGDTLPGDITQAYKTFKKIPIIMKDVNNNDIFDQGDYILFFGIAPHGVRFSKQNSKYYYYKNPYTDTTTYWIGIGSSTLLMDTLFVQPDTTINEISVFYHHERDLTNIGWKGILWEGESIIRASGSSEANLRLDFNLSEIHSPDGLLKIQLVGGWETSVRKVVIELNGTSLDTLTWSNYGIVKREINVSNLKSNNSLNIKLLPGAQGEGEEDIIYLDYVSCIYRKTTSSLSDEQAFYEGSDTMMAYIDLGLLSPLFVLDITQSTAPKIIPITQENGRFKASVFLAKGAMFYIAQNTKNPKKIKIEPRAGSLYNVEAGVNYIAITSKNFTSTLLKYKRYRESHLLKFDGEKWVESEGKVKIVAVEDIYRDFGFGQVDPVAIRNFLKQYFDSNPQDLLYVALFGDATYDYKNLRGGGNIVPAYEPVISSDIDDMKGARDEFYADMTGDGYADFYIGRIPVRTKEELSNFVDKLISYERKDLSGYWRSRYILVSDDEYNAAGIPSEMSWHLPYVDYIRRNLTLPFIEVREVYEIKYGSPGDIVERGREAKEAFIKTFNQGGLLLTFYGHGNPVQLTHEQMLLLQDLPKLKTSGKPPLTMFFSCKVGAFTRLDPAHGIAEYMAVQDQAIASIASTISQFVSVNDYYGRYIHNLINDRRIHPLGEIAQDGKIYYSLTYYTLFGDPATMFSLPLPDSSLQVQVPDSLEIGNINYAVIEEGTPTTLYHLNILHKPIEITYVNSTVSPSVTYTYLGENSPIFTGSFDIKILPDTLHFFLPVTADTGYGALMGITRKEGNKFLSYEIYPLHFIKGTIGEDKKGPSIKFFIGNIELEDTAEVPLNFNLRVVLEDSSGINLYTVFGTEKGIMLHMDNQFIDLRPYFEYYKNSFTKGEVNYPMEFEFSQDKDISLIAYDNLNNMSVKNLHLVIREREFSVSNILAYPNPVKNENSGVYFTFILSKPSWIEIKVFTIGGRLVWTSGRRYFNQGFGKIYWNLRDNFNDNISNGFYIYKLECKNEEGRKFEIKKGLLIAK